MTASATESLAPNRRDVKFTAATGAFTVKAAADRPGDLHYRRDAASAFLDRRKAERLERRARLDAILDREKFLTPDGFLWRAALNEIEAARSRFDPAEFNAALQFVRYLAPRKKINRRESSYSLKVLAERVCKRPISNGAVIAAMIASGFRHETHPHAPDALFNVRQRSIGAIDRMTNPKSRFWRG